MITQKALSPFGGKLEKACKNLFINEVTLREGEQFPGAAFTPEQKYEIAKRLDESGVDQIEVAVFTGPTEFAKHDVAKKICNMGLKKPTKTILLAQNPKWQEIADFVADVGSDTIQACIPTTKWWNNGGTWEDSDVDKYKQRMADVIKYLKGYNRKVDIAFLDATRADRDLLLDYVEFAAKSGADRVQYCDTIGCATPEGIEEMVTLGLERMVGTDAILGVHCHNDFNLALANTLAGVKAGAQMIDCSINGMGDRTGNPALIEIVVALEGLYNIETNIDVKSMYSLAKLVEEYSGVAIPPHKPLVGKYAFADEVDFHLLQHENDPYTLQGVLPEEFGGKRIITYGKGTGAYIINKTAATRGVTVPEEKIPLVQKGLYDRAIANKGRVLDTEDFWAVLDEIL